MIEAVGGQARRTVDFFGDVLGLFALTLKQLPKLAIRAKRQVFLAQFRRQLYNTGFRAAYVNCAIAVLLGLGLADQLFDYMTKIGNAADLFVVVVVRELAPMLSGIILIARSATAATAEIGYLRLNKEFDVLRAQGIDPVFLFILPVFFAFPISLLLMLVYFNFVCLVSAWSYLYFFADSEWPLSLLIAAVTDRLTDGELLVTSLKAMLGGVVIALVSLHSGWSVGGRFTDISRAISSSTTALLIAYFCISIGLSVLVY